MHHGASCFFAIDAALYASGRCSYFGADRLDDYNLFHILAVCANLQKTGSRSVKVCPIATMLELRITEFSSRTEKWSR